MKINKVIVKKLFGTFNHEIILKDDGITIIIGENGLGKTVILEMLNAFFNREFGYFKSIEFEELNIEYDDGMIWRIVNNSDNLIIKEKSIHNSNKGGENSHKYKIRFNDNNNNVNYSPIVRRLSESMPYVKEINSIDWTKSINYSINNIKYSDVMIFDNDKQKEPEWFKAKIEEIEVDLIKTQRLLVVEKQMDSLEMTNMVNRYSDELKQEISSKLAESTALSSDLDRTYPQRLIRYISEQEEETKSDDILEKLKELEDKRKMLASVGLMDIGNDLDILNTKDLEYNMIKAVLMIYISDSFKKLGKFDGTFQKINVLLNVVNTRFKHKKLYIDKEKGFIIKSTIIKDKSGNAKTIPLNKLSSGEQNELVLFYELIFKAKKNSLILIDEPEISLHISWQNNFIEDLKEIIKINNLEVLIATHSPDIIGNNWNCRVKLRGIE